MLVRQSVAVCGVTGIALTKLDVLDGFDEIKICTGYTLDGADARLSAGPCRRSGARSSRSTRRSKGWAGSTAGARSWAELPAQAIKYIRRIEELIHCPVALVSTSPERDDTILVRDPFARLALRRSTNSRRRAQRVDMVGARPLVSKISAVGRAGAVTTR